MMQFENQNIDEKDWLVIVACDNDVEELKNEAFEKLHKLGFTDEQIFSRFKELDTDEKQNLSFEKAWENQLESNSVEKYSFWEKVGIFFWGPINLFKYYKGGIISLYKENYKIKFRQKIILLSLGTIFWVLFAWGGYKYLEYKRIQKIDNVDISNWENNRIK
jgi:hypothetical protein